MKCVAEDCGRKASHRVMWKDADVSLVLCVEHFNVWVNDDVEVTTDLESVWRSPSRAQAVLDELCAQGLEHMEEGADEKAGATLGMIQAHVTNCATAGTELDQVNVEELERRLIGDIV